MESHSKSEELNLSHNSCDSQEMRNFRPYLEQNSGFAVYTQAEMSLPSHNVQYSSWSTPLVPQYGQNYYLPPPLSPWFPLTSTDQNSGAPVVSGPFRWPSEQSLLNPIVAHQTINVNFGSTSNVSNIGSTVSDKPPVLMAVPNPYLPQEDVLPCSAAPTAEKGQMPSLAPEGLFSDLPTGQMAAAPGIARGIQKATSSTSPASSRHDHFRKQHLFSKQQYAVLRNAFAVDQYAQNERLWNIAKEAGLSRRQVTTWFQNERYRQKENRRKELNREHTEQSEENNQLAHKPQPAP